MKASETRRWPRALIATALVLGACSGGIDRDQRADQATTTTNATAEPAPSPTADPATTAHAGPTRPPPTSVEPRHFTMAFAGDLLPHLPVVRSAAAAGAASGRAHDFGPLLDGIRPVISAADVALCHMEAPVAPDAESVRGYPAFGAPPELIAGAAATGYDGCSTASNHSLDQGRAGIDATLGTMDLLGLGHAGTGRTRTEAAAPAWYDAGGARIAHLSYAYGFNGIVPPADAPWSANRIDEGRILIEAAAARAEGADFVVVSLHWGTEYVAEPDSQQVALAPDLLASPDIDLLIGHHAHVVQPIQRFGGEWVVFGLGNQLSNQSQPERRDGLTVVVTVSERAGRFRVSAIRAVPTWVDLNGHRVLAVDASLADPATDPSRRAELLASLVRTTDVVNRAGAVSDGSVTIG